MKQLKNNQKEKLYFNWDKQAQTFWLELAINSQGQKLVENRELLEQNWDKQSETYWRELAQLRAYALPQIWTKGVCKID